MIDHRVRSKIALTPDYARNILSMEEYGRYENAILLLKTVKKTELETTDISHPQPTPYLLVTQQKWCNGVSVLANGTL